METRVHCCPHCKHLQSVPKSYWGGEIVCARKTCRKKLVADLGTHPDEFNSELNPASGCGKQLTGCLVAAIVIVGILALIILLGPKKDPKSIEQIQAEHLRRKVADEIQNEEAAKQRAIQETLERIRQKK